ncbi:MAG: 2OG-Fe dioxygenase family protein [Rudaea sp.]|nr:2OG-Fe dioxygenase family protein [Rudaea sp.]
MRDTEPAAHASLQAILQRDGFAFAKSARMRPLLERYGALTDWPAFAASWGDLALDRHLADHGRYRRRRHAVFRIGNGDAITREAHQPHYQSRDYNHLHGGIERWFEPIVPGIGSSASMCCILRFCTLLFGALAPDVRTWRVETHQFRIEARPDESGLPTPEGVHRDGVDYVLVLLVARRNIASGTTTIHSRNGKLLGSFTLAATFDAALVDDARVFHGVTPVEPIDPLQPAFRDVLVVTFKRT